MSDSNYVLLNFDKVWQPTNNLEFDGDGELQDVNITIRAEVALIASGTGTTEEELSSIGVHAFYDLNAIASGDLYYDANVFRGLVVDTVSKFETSKLLGRTKSSSFENNKRIEIRSNHIWQQSKRISIDYDVLYESNSRIQTSDQFLYEQAKLIGTSSQQLFSSLIFTAIKKQSLTEQARLIGYSAQFLNEAMNKVQIERQELYEGADWIGKYRDFSNRAATVLAKNYTERIEKAKGMYSAQSERFIIEPDAVKPVNLMLLDFICKWYEQDTRLRFGVTCQQDQEQNQPPSAGVIFVTNSVSLVRSDDGREIKLYSFSVGIDANSYAWSFSATVPLSELSKVNTIQEQRIGVDFTCNGNLWRFVLDACDDSIQFGESNLTIKGKSRAMLLTSPYSEPRSFKYDTAMSARQIADDELNRNGTPSGFTLDWQLAGVNGWNVPANTYSYTGKTPINSLQGIAEAAGGFINADMSADILHVLAHYPIPSWEWAAQTPSINLPMSLITSRSRGRINKPAYNGVTIYGENDNGIGALIKRTGTSGGYQPPMVTSDLITDYDVARSRGIAILSDTGDMGNIGLSMPLHSDFGVLKPSTLIGVNDGEQWIGMVRGTSITGKLSSNRALEIEQSLDIERHFDKG